MTNFNQFLNSAAKVSRKLKSNKNPVLVITTVGERRRENPRLPDYEWKILDELHESPATVKQLARQTGINEAKIKKICKNLKGSGYIQFTGSEDDWGG